MSENYFPKNEYKLVNLSQAIISGLWKVTKGRQKFRRQLDLWVRTPEVYGLLV